MQWQVLVCMLLNECLPFSLPAPSVLAEDNHAEGLAHLMMGDQGMSSVPFSLIPASFLHHLCAFSLKLQPFLAHAVLELHLPWFKEP
ncbi:hypothetical protein MHYP_G00242930 [Metynnis hypsauchen]